MSTVKLASKPGIEVGIPLSAPSHQGEGGRSSSFTGTEFTPLTVPLSLSSYSGLVQNESDRKVGPTPRVQLVTHRNSVEFLAFSEC